MATILTIDQQKAQEKTFEQNIKENYSAALAKAKRYIKAEEVAKDLVQEALIQAFLNIDKLKDKGAFRPWLLGIVRNTCLNHLRNEKIRYIDFKEELGEKPKNEEVKVPDELLGQLQKAVGELKEKDRKIIEEFYYEGHSIADIAEFSDLSIGNVKVRLYRARKALVKILGMGRAKTRMLWTQSTPMCLAA